MKGRLLARLVLATGVLATAVHAQESCGVCHGEQGELERLGVHAAAGIGCVECHGGSAGALDIAGAHGAGVHVARGARAAVELCGSCHADPERMRGFELRTDQRLLYEGSGHGRRLAEEDDPNVATCVTCHGAHGVLRHSDPRSPIHPQRQLETCGRCHADEALMRRYALPAEAPRLYRTSVHGMALLERGALNSPACTTCHGSHGATPPGMDKVGRVCGRCHSPSRENFERGPHAEPAREGVIEECVACHGSHAVERAADAMLIGSEVGHCGSCHQKSPDAVQVGVELHAQLTGFDTQIEAAERRLARASQRGVFVEYESDLLAEARALRGQAAPLVHSLSVQALSNRLELGRGMVAETLDSLGNKEREISDRQVLVLVFFGAVLLLSGVLLVHARMVAGRATGTSGGFEPEPEDGRGKAGRG